MADPTATSSPASSAAAPGAARAPFPRPENDAYLGYRAGTPEAARLAVELERQGGERSELPLVIGGERVTTGRTLEARVPHRHRQVLADVHQAGPAEVARAIDAAGGVFREWSAWPWQERLSVFMRAAALVVGPYRERLVAATMLDQSKTTYEAEADAACELADFFRFNAAAVEALYEVQPRSDAEAWNRMEYRPLEGFVYAVTPFNFTAIGGNLPTAPAMLGNVAVWKPSVHAMVSASIVMELLEEAGLPAGVINLVYGDPAEVTDVVLDHPDFAGLHFTGSTDVFRALWSRAGQNLDRYRSFPRLVGETGGKGFVLALPSANPQAVAAAVVKGAFGYQGQKCSAASRVYVPASLAGEVRDTIAAAIDRLVVGDPTDAATHVGAVIGEAAFARHRAAIAEAHGHAAARIVAGGTTDDAEGWFVQPTLVETTDPGFRLLADELFGPIVTMYVYDDGRVDETLRLIDTTSRYALTGSIFADDRVALGHAATALRFAAGNLYLNDKPTGAVVGAQPFGGGRASGTNDKTGTPLHMARWSSIRTVKDCFILPGADWPA